MRHGEGWDIEDRFVATLLGGAIGDALGNPVEGLEPDDIERRYGELTEFQSRWEDAGVYTDDMKMTLCIAESLVECGALSLDDIARRFVEWASQANSFGLACQEAVAAVDAECAERLRDLEGVRGLAPAVARERIGTSGFVLHSVPFAFQGFLDTGADFERSVVLAANSGGDADTNASLAGQLCGAHRGTSALPERWLAGLHNADHLESVARALFELFRLSAP